MHMLHRTHAHILCLHRHMFPEIIGGKRVRLLQVTSLLRADLAHEQCCVVVQCVICDNLTVSAQAEKTAMATTSRAVLLTLTNHATYPSSVKLLILDKYISHMTL